MVRARFRIAIIPVILLFLGLLHLLVQNHYLIRNTISYATRPIWDTADGPRNVIPHYYTEGMVLDTATCALHGWNERETNERNALKVIDAILISSELDLLEIRLNELDSVVDRFFIVESNASFTGLPKETHFRNNRQRFERFKNKIEYHMLPGYPLEAGQTPWVIEAQTRDYMTRLIKGHLTEFPPHVRTLVIMSDVDEIPSEHTISLLKACDFGRSIHLQLRNYLYSFEWFIGFGSWRSSVHMWTKGSYYRHSKSGDYMLADSGWHCSYCFKTIREYQAKMTGFSHSDRIGGRLNLLEPDRIQNIICKGKDIFGMLPEAYSYADLLAQMSPEPSTSGIGLPLYAITNQDKFRFLLPGGCRREEVLDMDVREKQAEVLAAP